MSTVTVRRAVAADLAAIVGLLADDPLGASREDASLPLDGRYIAAFAAIEADPNQSLVVAEAGRSIVGCLQVTFIPGVSRKGTWRGTIEGVRVAGGRRGGGIGREMVLFAIEACRRRGCGLVQLTTDKSRADALRFYEGLGFVASHEGMKLAL
jgi:ribosomal protein S18 acetylase RimI-like enzyme